MNYSLCLIFLVEIILDMLSKRIYFFKKFNRVFEAFIIFYATLLQSLEKINVVSPFSTSYTLAQVALVLRMMKFVDKVKFLKKMFTTLVCILPLIKNLLILLMIFFGIYGVIGMHYFAYIKPQTYLDSKFVNFKDFFSSTYILTRVLTLDGWWLINLDAMRNQAPNFVCSPVSNYNDYEVYGC